MCKMKSGTLCAFLVGIYITGGCIGYATGITSPLTIREAWPLVVFLFLLAAGLLWRAFWLLERE